MFTNWNLFELPWKLHLWCYCPFSKTVSDVSPGSVSWAFMLLLTSLWLWAPVCGEASPLLPQSLLQHPVAPLDSLGCSGSPPLLLIVAYWIDLLSRVFRSKTKWGSHGWPISAFPFNSVVKHCWLAGLVSTVYKKVLCKKSGFSHRPVWHQCRDDLLLESIIAELCRCSEWVSLATSLSYTEPKISHCAGGKSVCSRVFLINDFCMVCVFSLQMSLLGTDDWEMQQAPFAYFHRQHSLREGCLCVIVNWVVTSRPIVLVFHGRQRLSSSTENGLCRLAKSQWSFLDSLDLCKLPWLLLATLPFSLLYKYVRLDLYKGVYAASSSFAAILVTKGRVCDTSKWACIYIFGGQDSPILAGENAQTGGLISNLPSSVVACR